MEQSFMRGGAVLEDCAPAQAVLSHGPTDPGAVNAGALVSAPTMLTHLPGDGHPAFIEGAHESAAPRAAVSAVHTATQAVAAAHAPPSFTEALASATLVLAPPPDPEATISPDHHFYSVYDDQPQEEAGPTAPASPAERASVASNRRGTKRGREAVSGCNAQQDDDGAVSLPPSQRRRRVAAVEPSLGADWVIAAPSLTLEPATGTPLRSRHTAASSSSSGAQAAPLFTSPARGPIDARGAAQDDDEAAGDDAASCSTCGFNARKLQSSPGFRAFLMARARHSDASASQLDGGARSQRGVPAVVAMTCSPALSSLMAQGHHFSPSHKLPSRDAAEDMVGAVSPAPTMGLASTQTLGLGLVSPPAAATTATTPKSLRHPETLPFTLHPDVASLAIASLRSPPPSQVPAVAVTSPAVTVPAQSQCTVAGVASRSGAAVAAVVSVSSSAAVSSPAAMVDVAGAGASVTTSPSSLATTQLPFSVAGNSQPQRGGAEDEEGEEEDAHEGEEGLCSDNGTQDGGDGEALVSTQCSAGSGTVTALRALGEARWRAQVEPSQVFDVGPSLALDFYDATIGGGDSNGADVDEAAEPRGCDSNNNNLNGDAATGLPAAPYAGLVIAFNDGYLPNDAERALAGDTRPASSTWVDTRPAAGAADAQAASLRRQPSLPPSHHAPTAVGGAGDGSKAFEDFDEDDSAAHAALRAALPLAASALTSLTSLLAQERPDTGGAAAMPAAPVPLPRSLSTHSGGGSSGAALLRFSTLSTLARVPPAAPSSSSSAAASRSVTMSASRATDAGVTTRPSELQRSVSLVQPRPAPALGARPFAQQGARPLPGAAPTAPARASSTSSGTGWLTPHGPAPKQQATLPALFGKR